MLYGWSGRILRVDLSSASWSTDDTQSYSRSWIGGRGVGAKILFDEVGREVRSYDPANILFFGPGVLSGTLAPSSSRTKVMAMSTHGLMGSAGIGGSLGAAIRHAGYDALAIQGRSEVPVYLHIQDQSVEIRDAEHVWHQDTQETARRVREELGTPAEVVSIGPAGESLVNFACLITGMGSAAGRYGFGAIMGSKNLKAVAVRGTGQIRLAQPEEFVAACRETQQWLREHPGMRREAAGGVGDMYTLGSGLNEDPLGNWEADDASWDEVGSFGAPEEFYDRYAEGQYGCFGCPVNHFHMFYLPGVGHGMTKCNGWGSFASNVWNNDRKVMFHATYLCNAYGLDITATGNIISFLMELYHRGLISAKDTDGIPMERGDEAAILSAIHKIGKQEGFGRLFKNGVQAAAREIGPGAEECAMVVKGMEMEQYDVRAYKSMALAAAVNAGNQAEGGSIDYALWGDQEGAARWAAQQYGTSRVLDPTSYEKKAPMVADYEDRSVAVDLLGMCQWLIPWSITRSLEIPAKLFSLATGQDTTEDELLLAARRVKTLERAFNTMRGIRRGDDGFPKRLFETAVPGGRFKGERLDAVEFQRMLSEYYALRGWDEDGVPMKETFDNLGLSLEWETFEHQLEQGDNSGEQVTSDA
jgi:aldehyde:ferredoxin oxidoreductase